VVRVLVADDDSDLRALLKAALVRDGHEVIEAADGREALDTLSPLLFKETKHGPDLIVTDIRMPGVSGLSLVAGLRACGCTMPVIVISAHHGSKLHEEATRAGANAVLAKPFELDDLRTAVTNLVQPSYRARALTLPDPTQL
jgi:CheY-like chemotaxis protein